MSLRPDGGEAGVQRQRSFRTSSILKLHLGVIGILVAGHLLVTLGAALGHEELLGVSGLLNLADEGNVPTLFSALALLLCAGASALNAALEPAPGQVTGWRLLAAGFLFLACDEASQIHELFDQLPLGTSYAWMVPYALGVLVVALVMFPFAVRLPSAPRLLLIVGASLYVGSALGMELVEFAVVRRFTEDFYANWRFSLFITLEEAGEMVGVAIMLNALLRNLAAGGGVALRLSPLPPASEHAKEPASSDSQGVGVSERSAAW
jgi:hypothetical protein